MTVHIKMRLGEPFACGETKGEWTYARVSYQTVFAEELCENCKNSEEYGMYLLRNMDKDPWKVIRPKYYGTITGRLSK